LLRTAAHRDHSLYKKEQTKGIKKMKEKEIKGEKEWKKTRKMLLIVGDYSERGRKSKGDKRGKSEKLTYR
jgi:hypothetical protein